MNADYLNIKTLWWKPFKNVLSKDQKRHIDIDKKKKEEHKNKQLYLFAS